MKANGIVGVAIPQSMIHGRIQASCYDARASKNFRSDIFRTGFGIRGEHVPGAMRKRAAQGKSCSPLCIMWEPESPSCRPHSFSSFPPKNVTNSYQRNTAVFVRVLGGRDGLSHSGKLLWATELSGVKGTILPHHFWRGGRDCSYSILTEDRNMLRGSCELMPFWLKPLLCPSSSSFDHRKSKFRCRFPNWIDKGAHE